jgi:hypothetical protein
MKKVPFDGWVKKDGPLEVFYPRNAASAYLTCPADTLLETNASATVDTDKSVGDNDLRHWRSQGFQVDSDGKVGYISLWLKKVLVPTGTLTVSIQTDAAGLPSGTNVTNGVSTTVTATDLSTSYGWINFFFFIPPSLTAATQYHMVLKRSVADDATNYVIWGADASAPGYAEGTGEVYKLSTTTWSSEATDHAFCVYKDGWIWSAYSDISAATAADFIPVGIALSFNLSALTSGLKSCWIEYEIATGTAGNEVTLHRHVMMASNYMVSPGAATQNLCTTELTIPISPKLIPSGVRVCHRVRISDVIASCTANVRAYLCGYEAAIPACYPMYSSRAHLMGIHKGLTNFYPQGDSFITVTPAAFPNYGSWVEVLPAASVTHDLIVRGVAQMQTTQAAGASSLYVEIGTGENPNEVTRGRTAHPRAGTYAQLGVQYFDRRGILVKAGERLAIRATGSTATQKFKVLYEELNG